MKKLFKKLASSLSLIMIFSLITLSSTQVMAAEVDGDKIIAEVKDIIKYYYVDDVSDSVYKKDSIADILKGLNDPYSAYLTKEDYEGFINSIDNKFSGIGISIEMVQEGVKVITVFDKSPAKESEILPGDIIIEAAGRSMASLSSEEAIKYIRGIPGTFVELKIKRGQIGLSKKVERRELALPTVNSMVLNNIGYLQLVSFGESTSAEFKTELDKLNKAKVDSYILDLRYNSGGYMNVAFDIAGYFIGGNPCLEVKDNTGAKEIVNAVDHGKVIDKPVIFLINEYSASASEILAAAVKDYKKAYFIGEKTYGKGVGQTIFQLGDENYLKLTVLQFNSPKGKVINKVGVSPDLAIDDEKAEQDPLKLAQLLLSSSPSSTDKTGTLKVQLSDKSFEIKESLLKTEEFKASAEYLLKNVLKEDITSVWYDNQWIKSAELDKYIQSKQPQQIEESKKTETVAVETQKPETLQVAYNNSSNLKELPQTGSPINSGILLFTGFAFTAAGVFLKRK